MRLAEKTALTTGAARAIGRASAEVYVHEGARGAIADIDNARKMAAALGEVVIAVPLNATAHASIDNAVFDGKYWGGVDAFSTNRKGNVPGQKTDTIGRSVPHGRIGGAQDPNGVAIFLASDKADYIVAKTYTVDGGQWIN